MPILEQIKCYHIYVKSNRIDHQAPWHALEFHGISLMSLVFPCNQIMMFTKED